MGSLWLYLLQSRPHKLMDSTWIQNFLHIFVFFNRLSIPHDLVVVEIEAWVSQIYSPCGSASTSQVSPQSIAWTGRSIRLMFWGVPAAAARRATYWVGGALSLAPNQLVLLPSWGSNYCRATDWVGGASLWHRSSRCYCRVGVPVVVSMWRPLTILVLLFPTTE